MSRSCANNAALCTVTYAVTYALCTRIHIRTLHILCSLSHPQSIIHVTKSVTYPVCHIPSLSHCMGSVTYEVCHIPSLSNTQYVSCMRSVTYEVCHHALLVEENVNNPKKVILITLRVLSYMFMLNTHEAQSSHLVQLFYYIAQTSRFVSLGHLNCNPSPAQEILLLKYTVHSAT